MKSPLTSGKLAVLEISLPAQLRGRGRRVPSARPCTVSRHPAAPLGLQGHAGLHGSPGQDDMMAAIPLPPPRHRLHAQRPEAGRSRGVSRLSRGPKCPRDELAASQQHPAWPLSPFAVPFKGLLPQSGILCLPPAAPVLPQCNQYGGLYLQHHPLLTLGAESTWQEKIHLMCF